MQAHHTTRGCSWLAVEWHLGGWCQILAKPFWAVLFCIAYSSLPGNNHCPLPGDVYSSLPGNICQCPAWAPLQSLPGTLASSLPGNACQFPAWKLLPVCMPCLGMLAVPAWHACQFPAWERLVVPCLVTFCSPCLGRFVRSLAENVCQCPSCLGMFSSP